MQKKKKLKEKGKERESKKTRIFPAVIPRKISIFLPNKQRKENTNTQQWRTEEGKGLRELRRSKRKFITRTTTTSFLLLHLRLLRLRRRRLSPRRRSEPRPLCANLPSPWIATIDPRYLWSAITSAFIGSIKVFFFSRNWIQFWFFFSPENFVSGIQRVRRDKRFEDGVLGSPGSESESHTRRRRRRFAAARNEFPKFLILVQ